MISTIDDIDWDLFLKQIRRVKAYTQEQRSITIENTIPYLSDNILQKDINKIVIDFYLDNNFCRLANLNIMDPEN